MAEIDGGALSFKSVMDNDQLNGAIEETLKRVQGLSDAVVGSGDAMDEATQEMVECIEIQKKVVSDLENTIESLNARIQQTEPGDAQDILIQQAETARQELEEEKKGLAALNKQFAGLQQSTGSCVVTLEQVRLALGEIGSACEIHEQALADLETQYDKLGKEMSDAFMSGHDKEYNALKERRNAIDGEIKVRKKLLQELREQSNALEEEATKMQKTADETKKAAEAHVMLRTQIRDLKEQMAAAIASGMSENSEEYKAMANELGRLVDIQGDIMQQGKQLSNDEAQFQGIITGLGGLVGGFTAAQGAVALFAGENENLQKIMLKVQSLMSITMGLQQVAQTLNKDSAFQLVTINGLKEWWNHLLEVGRGNLEEENEALEDNIKETIKEGVATQANATAKAATANATKAATVAEGANTAATTAQATAATAGTAANISLAGAFRMVGAAIKSIPVLGWVLAGISALIGLVSHFVGKANDAKKAQEDWYKSVADNCYKPIGALESLATKWNALGDDMEAKKKFIEENQKAFNDLGVAVNGVTDAENLLVANKQAFIDAQIEKAKAVIYFEQTQSKVKELMEKQAKYDAMSDTSSYYIQTSSFGSGQYVEGKNHQKEKLGEEIKALKAEITKGYTDAADAEKNGWDKLKEAGIQATQTYANGSLGAIEQAISLKQAALKTLTNNSDYKKAMEEIEALQKQAESITGKKTNGGGSSASKDPFLEKLNKYKAEYTRFQKWVNSGDKILVESANKEFSGLLQEGATYIDYLKKQRDTILEVDVANRTKTQNKELRQLNNAIAEETKNTVLEAFNNELNDQLSNAQTVMDMLNIIEKKRQELANDGTDLDNAKGESLDEAEKDVQSQAQSEMESLLGEYASYVDKKRELEEQFNRDIKLLRFGAEKAQTDEEKKSYEEAIKNRTTRYAKDKRNIGGVDYDSMLAEFGTFEERKQAIIDQYEEKRKVAIREGNTEMVDEINKAQNEALSKFALDELQAHPDWELMFGDLDEVTTKKLQQLIDKINGLDGAYLGIQFDPKDLEVLKEKVQSMKDEIQSRNPFKAMIKSIKDYGKAADDESKKKSIKGMFEGASASIDMVSGTLDAVVGGLDKMGVKMDEETQAIIGDLGGIMDGASQVAQGIATGNPLSIIQGSIGLLSSAFDLFNFRDRKAEKQIRKHQEAIGRLQKAYKELEWQIQKALGGDVYKGQQEAIRNMKEQQEHLKASWEAEERKKKTDHGRVEDFKEQYEELGRQIDDIFDEISQDITQSNAKDFATELGDALVDAFAKGEDASKAFEQTVNNVLKNAIVNQLKKTFLEKQLDNALKQLEKQMGYWNGDDFIFDGLTEDEIASFKRRVQDAANDFNQAMGIYKDLFKDLNLEENDTSLSGAVKGITEESASIIAGQMNAMRIAQLETNRMLQQSLLTLNTIASNTSYNKYLARIERIITILESNGDSLRSQGLS